MSEATTFAQDVPEGWYDDPENPRLQRWWGGSDWTDHVRHSDRASQQRKPVALEAVARFEPAPLTVPDYSVRPNAFAAQPAFVPQPVLSPLPDFSAKPSFVAEPAGIAYVPMRSHDLPAAARPESWNPRAYSPSTTAVWLLALSPVVWTLLQLLNELTAPANAAALRSLAISGGLLAVLFFGVLADRRQLQRRSMSAPSVGWFFLGVVPYFTVRWLVLKREGTRYASPAITFIVLMVLSAALWIYVLGPTGLL